MATRDRPSVAKPRTARNPPHPRSRECSAQAATTALTPRESGLERQQSLAPEYANLPAMLKAELAKLK